MIKSFRHKGLQQLYAKANRKGLSADMEPKIVRIIARLDVATSPDMMDLPGFKLHPLKGKLKGYWAVTVTGNWRIVFQFEEGHVVDVDLIDYH